MLHDTIAVPLAPHKDCKAVRLNSSGKLLVICTNDGTCPIYASRVKTGDGRCQRVGTLAGHEGPVWSVRSSTALGLNHFRWLSPLSDSGAFVRQAALTRK